MTQPETSHRSGRSSIIRIVGGIIGGMVVGGIIGAIGGSVVGRKGCGNFGRLRGARNANVGGIVPVPLLFGFLILLFRLG